MDGGHAGRAVTSVALTEADLAAALPDVRTAQRFLRLRSGAVIRRDRWGIPHIKADDEYDLFFAQGFATAQDRLFQMDFDRLRSLGRAAEYLGPAALAQDRLMRRRQLARVSRLDYAIASRAVRNALDAYADGVNAFIATTRALPVEYKLLGAQPERWEPWHCISVFKVRNTAEGSFHGKLWLAHLAAQIGPDRAAKLSPGYQPGSPLTVPPGARYRGSVLAAAEELRKTIAVSSLLHDTLGGSNGWVICGARTASGLPLLAGDSHRALEAPNLYYQVHLLGGDFAVLGFSIPGMPMTLHFCHNEHVAWGMTAAATDTQDLFVERFRVAGGRIEYLYKDEWLPARTSIETLRARGAGEEQIEMVETRHGPVIAGDPRDGAALALADPGSSEGTPWLDATYAAMKAGSANELEQALQHWTDRVNNYVYADVHGEFGYVLCGRIPIRGSENGWGPVAGWSGTHEWQGCIPASELPRARNPQVGWVVSCNQRVVDASYPYYLTNFGSSHYRAERVATRIEELERARIRTGSAATVEDMVAIHSDVSSFPARSLQTALMRVGVFSGRAAEAARSFLDWNCDVTAHSSQVVVYEATLRRIEEQLVVAHYGSLASDLLNGADVGADEHWRRHLRPAVIAALERGDESLLPPGDSWTAVLSRSLEAAVTELTELFGPDRSQWCWGRLHHTDQQHPLSGAFPDAASLLNPPKVEMAGDSDTPLLAGSRVGAGFAVRSASVNRYVHDPADWSRGRWIVPLGASGHPGSLHYCDQQQLWARVETIPQMWDWDEIGRHAQTEQQLIAESW